MLNALPSRIALCSALVIGFQLLAEEEIKVKNNLVYATKDGKELKLDAYLPSGKGPRPSVLVIHGGGWMSGSKWQLGRYASANYESLIRRKYMDATIHPGAISGDPVVKVRLVIARNGRVISARVTGQSGLASWDRAVQKALDRVKFIKPFPESMKGSQKTFNLNFNSRSFS